MLLLLDTAADEHEPDDADDDADKAEASAVSPRLSDDERPPSAVSLLVTHELRPDFKLEEIQISSLLI